MIRVVGRTFKTSNVAEYSVGTMLHIVRRVSGKYIIAWYVQPLGERGGSAMHAISKIPGNTPPTNYGDLIVAESS